MRKIEVIKYKQFGLFGINLLIRNKRKVRQRPNVRTWVNNLAAKVREGIDTPIYSIQITPYLTNREFNDFMNQLKASLPFSVTHIRVYKRAKNNG